MYFTKNTWRIKLLLEKSQTECALPTNRTGYTPWSLDSLVEEYDRQHPS